MTHTSKSKLYGGTGNPENRGSNLGLKKAKARLKTRKEAYDSMKDTKGYRRPGSMKVRSN